MPYPVLRENVQAVTQTLTGSLIGKRAGNTNAQHRHIEFIVTQRRVWIGQHLTCRHNKHIKTFLCGRCPRHHVFNAPGPHIRHTLQHPRPIRKQPHKIDAVGKSRLQGIRKIKIPPPVARIEIINPLLPRKHGRSHRHLIILRDPVIGHNSRASPAVPASANKQQENHR